MDTREIIRRIEEGSGMYETARVTTFKGYRDDASGIMREITVEIQDAGEGAGSYRYSIAAYSDAGKQAHSNSAATLDESIA